jgi:hypothetical protein
VSPGEFKVFLVLTLATFISFCRLNRNPANPLLSYVIDFFMMAMSLTMILAVVFVLCNVRTLLMSDKTAAMVRSCTAGAYEPCHMLRENENLINVHLAAILERACFNGEELACYDAANVWINKEYRDFSRAKKFYHLGCAQGYRLACEYARMYNEY